MGQNELDFIQTTPLSLDHLDGIFPAMSCIAQAVRPDDRGSVSASGLEDERHTAAESRRHRERTRRQGTLFE
jgi:hypothetical protein